MSQSPSPSGQAMQVLVNSGEMHYTHEFPFVFPTLCEDESIAVMSDGEGSGETILSITIEADASVSNIFYFVLENGDHKLRVTKTDCLVSIGNGALSPLPLPARPSVLVFNNGAGSWLPCGNTEGSFVLGVDDGGNWTWYALDTCPENATGKGV